MSENMVELISKVLRSDPALKEKVLQSVSPEQSKMGNMFLFGFGIFIGGVAIWQLRNLLKKF